MLTGRKLCDDKLMDQKLFKLFELTDRKLCDNKLMRCFHKIIFQFDIHHANIQGTCPMFVFLSGLWKHKVPYGQSVISIYNAVSLSHNTFVK